MLIHDDSTPTDGPADGGLTPTSHHPARKSTILRVCGILAVSLLLAYGEMVLLLSTMYHRYGASTLI